MFIPELVALGISLVPNKHNLNGLHIKFVMLVSRYMHVPLASEDAQVRDVRCFARVPELKKCTGGRGVALWSAALHANSQKPLDKPAVCNIAVALSSMVRLNAQLSCLIVVNLAS